MSNAYPYPEGMLVGGNNWKRREEIIQLFLGFVFVDLQEKIELQNVRIIICFSLFYAEVDSK